eukprot:jgi/Bigna1/142311/aug1.69_g17019
MERNGGRFRPLIGFYIFPAPPTDLKRRGIPTGSLIEVCCHCVRVPSNTVTGEPPPFKGPPKTWVFDLSPPSADNINKHFLSADSNFGKCFCIRVEDNLVQDVYRMRTLTEIHQSGFQMDNASLEIMKHEERIMRDKGPMLDAAICWYGDNREKLKEQYWEKLKKINPEVGDLEKRIDREAHRIMARKAAAYSPLADDQDPLSNNSSSNSMMPTERSLEAKMKNLIHRLAIEEMRFLKMLNATSSLNTIDDIAAMIRFLLLENMKKSSIVDDIFGLYQRGYEDLIMTSDDPKSLVKRARATLDSTYHQTNVFKHIDAVNEERLNEMGIMEPLPPSLSSLSSQNNTTENKRNETRGLRFDDFEKRFSRYSKNFPSFGVVERIAGKESSSGLRGTKDGIGSKARFHSPYGIALFSREGEGGDAANDVQNEDLGIMLLTDNAAQVIRRIEKDGIVTTLAGRRTKKGGGYRDGPFSNALFGGLSGITRGRNNDEFFVCDSGNSVIRKLNLKTKEVSTYFGIPDSVDKMHIIAMKGYLTAEDQRYLGFDKEEEGGGRGGRLYSMEKIQDFEDVQREFNITQQLIAQKPKEMLFHPDGVAYGSHDGWLYVSDTLHNRIVKIKPHNDDDLDYGSHLYDVAVIVIAMYVLLPCLYLPYLGGLLEGTNDGFTFLTELHSDLGKSRYVKRLITIFWVHDYKYCQVSLYICDTMNDKIRKLDLKNGIVTSITQPTAPEQMIHSYSLKNKPGVSNILSVAVDPVSARVYFSREHFMALYSVCHDGNNLNIIAGNQEVGGNEVGESNEAMFTSPCGIALNTRQHSLFICDGGNQDLKVLRLHRNTKEIYQAAASVVSSPSTALHDNNDGSGEDTGSLSENQMEEIHQMADIMKAMHNATMDSSNDLKRP